MTNQKKLEKFQEMFKDHKLTIELDTPETKVYLFESPNNSNLWQRWILNNYRLIVTGDAYDSIYYGGAFTSLKDIADCDLSYFNGKCVADRDGYKQSIFDNEIAHQSLTQMAIDYFADEGLFKGSDSTEGKIELINEHLEEKHSFEIPDSFDGEPDFWMFMQEHGNEVAGCDWWDAIKPHKLNNHPFWHLAAIKEAVKQI